MRRSSLVVSLASLASLLSVAGCDCSGPMRNGCNTSADCRDGQQCIDMMCVTPTDAGPIDGSAIDAPGCVDRDGDGYFGNTAECPTGDDCSDTDPMLHPGASELCSDGVDQDCDSMVDEPDCACQPGERVTCYTGPAATAGVGACRRGIAECVSVGTIGECLGEALPGPEDDVTLHCNGEDDDCDREIDEGLRNRCGECADEREEMCGNDLDDDCDGLTDEDCNCDYRCLCDPMVSSCECSPPTNQPCYEGPFGTDGNGICTGGRRDCVADPLSGEERWAACTGQVLPGTECAAGVGANGADEDCDDVIDEGCRDSDGDGRPWPADCIDDDPTAGPGAPEVCNERDDDCDGAADEGVSNRCGGCGTPAMTDVCDNGRDDDCDGEIDDGCACTAGAMQPCYGGPPMTEGVAACRAGSQTCMGDEFARWGACDDVIPTPEVCNGTDDDCDGDTDERWAAGSNRCGFCDGTERCDMLDNDCDGRTDEGVANRCGACGPEPVEACNSMDDDCDGVTDEGVVNACGTCPPEPCFTEDWDRPADCTDPGRTCDAIEEHPDHPGAITLGQSMSELPLIYIAVTGRNMVAQLNTDTGAVNWIRNSFGRWPSRTAVARDGSVWVGNRGHISSNPLDPAQSNVVHLDIDGNFVCRADVTGIARAVAIDALGNIWAGSYDGRRIWHISGTDVDAAMSPARCRVIATYDVGANIYGITVDPSGFVWTASNPSIRLDTRTGAWTAVPNPDWYGVAPDGAGNVWFGAWFAGGRLHALRSDGSVLNTSTSQITAVTVHPDGNVWGTAYSANQLVGINPTTGAEFCRIATPTLGGGNPHGVAVDRMGRIWAPNRYGGYVNVFGPDCRFITSYLVDPGQELYSYSDMTGHLLRTFTAPEGTWTQVYDSGYALAYWSELTWTADVPADTSVSATLRAADDVAGLASATPCGPFTTQPVDLATACSLGRHRYLSVELTLASTRAGARPIVYDVHASWAY